MLFYQVFGDGQPKPGAFAHTFGSGSYLVELVEDNLLIFVANAEA
jgi:hypothetical protein